MPAQKGNQPVNTFVKGLITEVSPLSFPEDASLDEVNFKLKRDGTRERRLGIDLEENYAYYNMGLNLNTLPSSTQSVFHWPSPNGSTKVDIGVVQIGRHIAFINLLTANPSANVLNGGVAIDTGMVPEAVWEFAVINNMLVAVNSYLDRPFLVQYNDVTDVISYENADIQIRDLYGVQDNLEVHVRPTSLSNEHKYNLRNQGWSESIISTCGTDVLDCTFTTHGVYPSNSDQWGIGRVADLTSADLSKYDPNVAARNIVDGGQVPKGHYIIDLYNRGLSRFNYTGITLPQDRETTHISTVASYAGRAWYSGIRGKVDNGDDRSPQLSNAILYSQIMRSHGDLVKCYQEADPTSYEFNELVDTDGGIVHIPEAVNIVKLKPIKQSLFVFAENGVWEIRGDDGGFRATSFQINKISSVGVYSPRSIVEANGTIFFWAISGIYNISPNQQLFGIWDTNNVTLSTIQKLYNSLPDLVKKNAKGYYDLNSNTVRWLYTSDSAKVIGDPVDIQPPAVPVVQMSLTNAIIASIDGSEPEICKVNSNTAIVIYRTFATSYLILYYRILTIDINGNVSTGAETVLIDLSPGNLSGYALCYLQDNKIIVTFRSTADTFVKVGNYSGGVMTFTGSTSINTESFPVLQTSQFRLARVSSTRVILAFKNTDLSKLSTQIIDIGITDTITTGLVAKSSITSIINPRITMLTSTKGVLCWTAGVRQTMIVFTISGTNILYDSTSYSFTNLTQYPNPPYTNRDNTYGDIKTINSTQILYCGDGTLTTGAGTIYAPILFIVNESSGALTSVSSLQDTTITSVNSENSYPILTTDGGINLSVMGTSETTPKRLVLTKYTGTTTPVKSISLDLDSHATSRFFQPEVCYLGSNRYIIVSWTTIVNSTIKAYSVLAA